MNNKDSYSQFHKKIEELNSQSCKRILPSPVQSGIVNLSSNDYLGLSDNETLVDHFFNQLPKDFLKFSSSSSRLLTGNSAPYSMLEDAMSKAFSREACLIYNSGYHANIGILPALTTSKDLIVADKLVHASIIDGIRLSQAELKRFNHLDYEHLEKILEEHRDQYEHVYIVAESIYSMDGDCSDLTRLVAIKKKFDSFLYIDEAHAIGVRGENGLGLCEEQNCVNNIDFIIGTFGKALASYGAYIVCDEIIKQYLVNTSRSMIFTTALSPIQIAWSLFIFQKIAGYKNLRKNLTTVSKHLSIVLKSKSTSHIIPYIVGENDQAVLLSEYLKDNGFYVLPIRHPTVPKGTARLRFSLTASISEHDITDLISILNKS